MRSKSPTVGIAPGHGLIARFGGIVVYLSAETAATDRILGTIEAVADTEHPGAALAQRLAAVVFGSTSDVPPFGLVAPTADGTLILLRGPVFAEISGAEGTRRLTGARAFTWVDEIVREPLRRITVGSDDAGSLTAAPRTDLRAGVVPGGGFVLQVALRRASKGAKSAAAARSSTPSSAPEPDATAASGFTAMPEPTGAEAAVDGGSAGSPAVTLSAGQSPAASTSASSASGDQSPSATASSTAAPVSTAAAPVRGRNAKRAEPSRPLARPRPPVGNRSTANAWPPPIDRPETVALHKASADRSVRVLRPTTAPLHKTIGTLILENGTAYPLDRPYVIGRGPQADDSVRTATAAPIVIQRDRHVSRVHAYVSVDRGKVFVRDATDTSGTFIAPPGTDQWTRISTAPTELLPGWSVRISERILTYRPEDHPAS